MYLASNKTHRANRTTGQAYINIAHEFAPDTPPAELLAATNAMIAANARILAAASEGNVYCNVSILSPEVIADRATRRAAAQAAAQAARKTATAGAPATPPTQAPAK